MQADATGANSGCTLSPELVEGPYYVNDTLFRGSITEDQPGLPLNLRVKVVDTSCNPLVDVFVDIWSCNSTGFYSGYTREPACTPACVHLICLYATPVTFFKALSSCAPAQSEVACMSSCPAPARLIQQQEKLINYLKAGVWHMGLEKSCVGIGLPFSLHLVSKLQAHMLHSMRV